MSSFQYKAISVSISISIRNSTVNVNVNANVTVTVIEEHVVELCYDCFTILSQR
jgi:hypothetical protein